MKLPFPSRVSWSTALPVGPPMSEAELAGLVDPVTTWRRELLGQPVPSPGPRPEFQRAHIGIWTASIAARVREVFGE